jgi:hypothetical protein
MMKITTTIGYAWWRGTAVPCPGPGTLWVRRSAPTHHPDEFIKVHHSPDTAGSTTM